MYKSVQSLTASCSHAHYDSRNYWENIIFSACQILIMSWWLGSETSLKVVNVVKVYRWDEWVQHCLLLCMLCALLGLTISLTITDHFTDHLSILRYHTGDVTRLSVADISEVPSCCAHSEAVVLRSWSWFCNVLVFAKQVLLILMWQTLLLLND